MARKKPPKRSQSKTRRAGSAYERVVAEVVKAMDPDATVRQGEWVTGPDGARELDVLVTGTVDGKTRTMLIECKDFNPDSTGAVGIGYVDALESKRRDLDVHAAVLCSNAGFTKDAIRKASRVNIGLIGVMKKGDARIRFLIPEALYTRQIQVEELTIGLHSGGSRVNVEGVPFESIRYDGLPLANWIIRRVMLALQNPIVSGSFTATHKLKESITLELPAGAVSVDQIDFHLTITGGWYVQEVTYDATAGLYDWLRRRVRMAPGPGQFHINGVDVHSGDPVDRPPDYVLSKDALLQGEMTLSLVLLEGLGEPEPGPELDALVVPEDLDPVMPEVPPEAYTSSSAA
jgi:hypothetical protein